MANLSTDPMECLNDAACFISQSRAVIEAVIYAHIEGEQPVEPNALYGIRSLLDCAFKRMEEARDAGHEGRG